MKKRIILLSAAGIGAGLVYLLTRNGRETVRAKTENTDAKGREEGLQPSLSSRARNTESGNGKQDVVIDDLGTGQSEASHILQNIRDAAFESSDEKLALALGRPTEEIEEWTAGAGLIDGDVIMKARALALNRGIEIE